VRQIENRKDVEHLVDQFYKKVIHDDQIGHFFTEVVQLNWDEHMPTMYNFWDSILLGSGVYEGNPMIKHIDLNRKSPLLPKHFDRWLELWQQTVAELYTGEVAEEAVSRATQIAELMKFKVNTV
jgi:hemoglobin